MGEEASYYGEGEGFGGVVVVVISVPVDISQVKNERKM